MAVAVPLTDGDQAHRRAERAIQAGALAGGPVMGDLDHVHGRDGACGEERVLFGLSEVAEEQGSESGTLGEHGEAAGVAGVLRGAGRWRPEHPPGEVAEAARHPGAALFDGDALRGEDGERPLVRLPRGSLRQRALHARRHSRDPAGVVGVEVREDEEVDRRDPEPVKTGRCGLRLAADIDHPDGAAIAEQQRVALSHVAGRHLPVLWDRQHATGRSPTQHGEVPDSAHAKSQPGGRGDDPW
jgi:hypothetical protein